MIKASFLLPAHPEHAATTPGPRAAGEFRFMSLDFHACRPPAPGEECFLDHACPLRGGNCGLLWVGNGHKPPSTELHKHTWAWDGDLEVPTLTPSINCLSHGPNGEEYAGCGWHGFLTAGEWRPC